LLLVGNLYQICKFRPLKTSDGVFTEDASSLLRQHGGRSQSTCYQLLCDTFLSTGGRFLLGSASNNLIISKLTLEKNQST
jgi:hypothetical protein